MTNQTLTHLFVGSTNPVKIKAVRLAVDHKWPDLEIIGFDVASGVSEQPSSDEETMTGSINRAKAALAQGLAHHPDLDPQLCLGIGLEGGVTEFLGDLWSTVWVTAVNHDGQTFSGNGARVKLPDSIAIPIRTGGEMGPVMELLSGTNNVRQKQGMIGIVTDNYVDRAEEYGAIAKFTIGLWYGRDWENQLRQTA